MSSSNSDDNEEWEAVETQNGETPVKDLAAPISGIEIQLPLSQQVKLPVKPRKKRTGETKEARVIRYTIHQAHLLCLVAVASRANFALCRNELDLQAIVISALSMDIEIRNTGKFYTRITKLCIAWRESFRVKDFDYDEASDQYSNEYAKYLEKQVEEKEISCTPSPDSDALYINHQLSVMGFIAWMRSLGYRCRLIASLHPASLSSSTKPRKRRESVKNTLKKRRRTDDEPSTSTNGTPNASVNDALAVTPSVIDIDDIIDEKTDLDYPIIYWCEIYNPEIKEWEPVCPIRCLVADIEKMEPLASEAPQFQYSYIFALPEQQSRVIELVDVTQRYASHYSTRTSKLRIPNESEWLYHLFWLVTKSRQDQGQEYIKEAKKLEAEKINEKMPTTLGGFNNHPIYALERQLKKSEILHADAFQDTIGHFKGNAVFKREYVKKLRSRETWTKDGMVVKANETPARFVASRAMTIKRKREIEAYEDTEVLGDDADPSKSGLFAEWQVEAFDAGPITDSIIPRNTFGNFDLLHENFLPPNCVHINIPGVAKVAKQLGITYAPAMIGFEFTKGRSYPIVKGIVTFAEHKLILESAAEEAQRILEEKAREKRAANAWTNWKILISKAINRDRLFREYMPASSS